MHTKVDLQIARELCAHRVLVCGCASEHCIENICAHLAYIIATLRSSPHSYSSFDTYVCDIVLLWSRNGPDVPYLCVCITM